MSNTNVGAVYNQVINDVIEAVRIDFEESGVEESVLQELHKVCVLPFLLLWSAFPIPFAWSFQSYCHLRFSVMLCGSMAESMLRLSTWAVAACF